MPPVDPGLGLLAPALRGAWSNFHDRVFAQARTRWTTRLTAPGTSGSRPWTSTAPCPGTTPTPSSIGWPVVLLFCTRITTCYPDRVATCALISYQDYHILLLTLAGCRALLALGPARPFPPAVAPGPLLTSCHTCLAWACGVKGGRQLRASLDWADPP